MARAIASAALARAYLLAKEFVIREGFQREIDWQEDVSLATVTESDFLREAAWVVLCSGFRENVLSARFGRISEAFLEWKSSEQICQQRDWCRKRALQAFRNTAKIDAILTIANTTARVGFAAVKNRIEKEGVQFLMEFPFIGPVTALHLAKNLGMAVVKPDRHLIRLAELTCFSSPDHLCRAIGSAIAEKISVVDLVIWRFATLDSHYETWFRQAISGAPTSRLATVGGMNQ